MLAQGRPGELVSLRSQFKPGEPTADDHERAKSLASVSIVGRGGELQLAQNSLPQVDRLSDRFEAVRVLADARDAKRFGDRAGVEHQAIPAQPQLLTVSPVHRARLCSGVNRRGRPDHDRRRRKRRSERSGYASRIDHTSGHIREQRRVDHVIARTYEHHFRRGGEITSEPTGAVKA